LFDVVEHDDKSLVWKIAACEFMKMFYFAERFAQLARSGSLSARPVFNCLVETSSF